MSDCIFCRIVRGEIPARKLYEDEQVVAFLDAFPLARGHTLVVPRAHVERVEQLDDQQAKALFSATHKLTARIQRAVGAPATTLGINNGPEAGQAVPHVHVHIVPRTGKDAGGGIHSLDWPRPKLAAEEMDKLALSIRALP